MMTRNPTQYTLPTENGSRTRHYAFNKLTNSAVLDKIMSAPFRRSSGSSPNPHSTPTVCAWAALPERISTDVSPTIKQDSGGTFNVCAA